MRIELCLIMPINLAHHIADKKKKKKKKENMR